MASDPRDTQIAALKRERDIARRAHNEAEQEATQLEAALGRTVKTLVELFAAFDSGATVIASDLRTRINSIIADPRCKAAAKKLKEETQS
jgi:hypothetical protein